MLVFLLCTGYVVLEDSLDPGDGSSARDFDGMEMTGGMASMILIEIKAVMASVMSAVASCVAALMSQTS